MKTIPDFVIIGAMKCATSTLHDQLALQPGIFMTTPKEPNFFNDEERVRSDRAWYTSLFRDAEEGDLCGESSTHYTKRPTWEGTAQRLRDAAPEARLVYVIRHPVDRLVSQYVHEWTENRIREPIDRAVERHPELVDYSRYAWQLEPYLDTFGAERIHVVLFEELVADPQRELERVCRFLGYDGTPRWHEEHEQKNASRFRLRKCGWRDAIIHQPALAQLRRRLVPKAVRRWVQSWWQMKQRPGLSVATRERLVPVFDRDLAALEPLLGRRLDAASSWKPAGRDAEAPKSGSLEATSRTVRTAGGELRP